MNDKTVREQQQKFVDELIEVSGALGVWAQERFLNNWSIEDVKIALRNAAKICGRDL